MLKKLLIAGSIVCLSRAALKKEAVGNTALANLGCYKSIEDEFYSSFHTYDDKNEGLGNGFSLPEPNMPRSAFILSYQEAIKYIALEYEYMTCSLPEAFENYKLLDKKSKGKIGVYWLRSPGKDRNSASRAGIFMFGGSISSGNVRETYSIRPCLWVRCQVPN
jgi:hypothetical protein